MTSSPLALSEQLQRLADHAARLQEAVQLETRELDACRKAAEEAVQREAEAAHEAYDGYRSVLRRALEYLLERVPESKSDDESYCMLYGLLEEHVRREMAEVAALTEKLASSQHAREEELVACGEALLPNTALNDTPLASGDAAVAVEDVDDTHIKGLIVNEERLANAERNEILRLEHECHELEQRAQRQALRYAKELFGVA